MKKSIKLAFSLMISSVFYSFAQENDCHNLNINVGSEFQQGESLNIGPPGLPGKHGPAGSKGDSGPKGNKGDAGKVPFEAESKIIENNRILLDISQQFIEVFQENENKMNKMQEDLNELKLENLKLKYDLNNSVLADGSSSTPDKPIEKEERFYKTCSEMHVFNPEAVSGVYILNPSGHNYIRVFCNVTDTTAITTIRHNIQGEINIRGFDPHYSYGKHVEYEISPGYIREIIDTHLYCRQFIKYRCKGSILLKSGDQYGYWASQDNTRRNYWGGSAKSNHCACGMTDTCIDKSYKCNCDQNSINIITSDEGYLDNKNDLPVGYLRFGDTAGNGENGWYELGPLECF